VLRALAAVVGEDGNEREILSGTVDDAARGRAHVSAFIGPILLRILHLGLFGRRAKDREALASRAIGIIHVCSPVVRRRGT